MENKLLEKLKSGSRQDYLETLLQWEQEDNRNFELGFKKQRVASKTIAKFIKELPHSESKRLGVLWTPEVCLRELGAPVDPKLLTTVKLGLTGWVRDLSCGKPSGSYDLDELSEMGFKMTEEKPKPTVPEFRPIGVPEFKPMPKGPWIGPPVPEFREPNKNNLKPLRRPPRQIGPQ